MFELHPRLEEDCLLVGDLELCRLLLMNDSHYPWFILVPMRNNKREIYELEEADQLQLNRESTQLAHCLMEHFKGDKMNTAALGNQVPQLHVHHIVRYEHDTAWPGPVWGKVPASPYSQQQADDILGILGTKMGVNQG